MTCVVPEIVWPECTVPPVGDSDVFAVWNIARAIIEAARCVIEEGPCPDGHKCPSSGKWLTGDPEGLDEYHGVQMPPVDICPGCCGSVVVTPRYPRNIVETDDCGIDPLDVSFDLYVTWDCKTPTITRVLETFYLQQNLTNMICCKLAAFNDPKTCPASKVRLTEIDDNPQLECPSVRLTYQAAL